LEKFVKDCFPCVEPHHAEAGEEREEEGATETKHYELTAAHITCAPVLLRGRRRRSQE